MLCEQPELYERCEQSEQSKQYEQSEHSEQREQSEQPKQSEQSVKLLLLINADSSVSREAFHELFFSSYHLFFIFFISLLN